MCAGMSSLLTRSFWADATERAASTAAQALVASLALGTDIGFDVLAVDWRGALSLAGGAAALSLLKAVAAVRVGERGTASLVP